MSSAISYVLPFEKLSRKSLPHVGGKNASLGELITGLKDVGVRVPDGFAVTVAGYHRFIGHNGLAPFISEEINRAHRGDGEARAAGEAIRTRIETGSMPDDLGREIIGAYLALCADAGLETVSVAVRSSATAEDLPEASFAGQQDTYLCVDGVDAVLAHCIRCFASLFTDRAIAYRAEQGLAHLMPEMSVGVQRMVRSDIGASGVAFSLDTETGFRDAVLINASWGLGETVVQGSVNPDEFVLFKPFLDNDSAPIISKTLGEKQTMMVCRRRGGTALTEIVDTPRKKRRAFSLSDAEAHELAATVSLIEAHFGCPVDTEWALDGETGELFIVQARPETVHSRNALKSHKSYTLGRRGRELSTGVAIGDAAAAGRARRLMSVGEADKFAEGEILVTGMTDPNWLPVMRKAAAIVTDRGGRTSHAAIVSRELGLPAVTGTGSATSLIEDGAPITVACCEGTTGRVYEGEADILVSDVCLDGLPETTTQVMLNLADPASALGWWRLPCDGVGLARMEFIIANHIRIHPNALIHYPHLPDAKVTRAIAAFTEGYDDKRRFFIEQLARGIAMIAASVWPKPVVVRTSDFKTNEYADLLGGALFEPKEENPMIGWRGAARYIHPDYREAFAMECAALRLVRDSLGFINVKAMVPFCRTPEEGAKVIDMFSENGLVQGENGLEIYAMCEVPSNVILVEEFASIFDGFSIGSNDLTQLMLGIDRDGERLNHLFDESHPAVKRAITAVIEGAHRHGRKVGLCGQGPSDNPRFARFLSAVGIDSVSVTPDSFIKVKESVHAAERMAASNVVALPGE